MRTPWRRTWSLALVVALALAGCGGSDEGPAATGPGPGTARPASSTPSATSATSSSDAAARWVGTVWTSQVGASSGIPLVDGEPIPLTSVFGLCADPDCTSSLDLLTDQPVEGPPPAGPATLWASRFVARSPDGPVTWKVTDARSLTLAEGETTYLCSPTGEPTVPVLGIAPTATAGTSIVEPSSVWTIDAAGALTSPDPSRYRCEAGQD